jgi:hypothetical protein
MGKRFTWKVWLRSNPLTPDVENDSTADVSTAGKTLGNADIAHDIKEEGSELSEETILDILNRGDRDQIRRLQEGYSVQTGVVHMEPAVLGKWIGEHPQYHADEHKKTVRTVPTGETRKALEDVDVEVLGLKADGGAFISTVTDVTTGKTDGTVTSGGQIIITGDKIKIDPADEVGLGVFIDSLTGGTMFLPGPYAHNTSKQIIAVLPMLADGPYTLYIVTRYAGGNTLLNNQRKVVYALTLYVGVRP